MILIDERFVGNGYFPPYGEMAVDMLKRIKKFSQEGYNVYLGPSGVPFTLEGNGDGAGELKVDETAINIELFKHFVGGVVYRIRKVAFLDF